MLVSHVSCLFPLAARSALKLKFRNFRGSNWSYGGRWPHINVDVETQKGAVDSAQCIKQSCKVGKVGREDLIMPTWNQL